MRSTVRIDEELLREAKALAARTGKSLTAVVEEVLRESLARSRRTFPPEPVRLITVGGRGLCPGIKLDNSASLLDVMGAQGDEGWRA